MKTDCQITNNVNSELMAGKNDQNFIAFCNELRAYISEKHHFPNKHTRLLNKIKFVRRKINQGTLEEWKLKMFLDIAGMRDMDGHTGGRKKKQKEQ